MSRELSFFPIPLLLMIKKLYKQKLFVLIFFKNLCRLP